MKACGNRVAGRPDGTAHNALGAEQIAEAWRLNEALLRAPDVQVALSGFDAFALISLLQLTLRHPGNNGLCAEVARKTIEVLRRQLPAELEGLIDRGFDRAHDVPA